MNEVIINAINSINQILESQSESFIKHEKSELADIQKNLNQLLKRDSFKNDWMPLFCSCLSRLINYNESLPKFFWMDLHDDILYILKDADGKQNVGNSWERFLKKMTLERELEKRKLQFRKVFGERKSLHHLFSNHKEFFKQYLMKCISFHSKVQVQGVIENIDDLLDKACEFTEVSATSKGRKPSCIEIPINFPNRSLKRSLIRFSAPDKSNLTLSSSLSNFLPSVKSPPFVKSINSETIDSVLQSNRWVVILGDPGSAKTTLLRWITQSLAYTAHSYMEKTECEGNDRSIVRIPILIRIGEFAVWLSRHPKNTLIDYVGEHTWLSERYCDDDGGSLLKELVFHGHALILLDGLDEIPNFEQRDDIVNIVEKFYDEYVRTPDFISAFDFEMFNGRSPPNWARTIIETQLPSISSGNQIIITSRIVGYRLRPLSGPFIEHYSLLLMDHKEAKEFVKDWMESVENSLLEVPTNAKIKFDVNLGETLSQRRFEALEKMFECGSELLMSNPFLLSLICASIFQSPDAFNPKSRVEVYEHAVQAALRCWMSQTSIISENMLTNLFIDLASYLHLNSPSGLIDMFDMERLCCLSFKQQRLSNNQKILRECTKELISMLDTHVGIVVERGLQAFGFLHLSFQEYFVAQSFIKGPIDEVAERIVAFIINPRYRESLLFALDWISRKWSFEDYDTVCSILVTSRKDYSIPLGALLFFDFFNDLCTIPSNSVMFIALNALIDHRSNVIAGAHFIVNLFKLPDDIKLKWMQLNLTNDKRVFKFCQCLPMKSDEYDRIIKTDLKLKLSLVYQQLYQLYNISIAGEFVIDQFFRKLIESNSVPDGIFKNELTSYIVSHNIDITKTHPLILSVIIAVCGGTYLKREETNLKIQFLPQQMHRESSILTSIIAYFSNSEESHNIKIKTLIDHYESILRESSREDVSVDIVDTFIVLICLQSVSQPLIYQKYDGYQALPLALKRLKRTWFYLKNSFDAISSNNNDKNKPKVTSKVELTLDALFSQTDQTNVANLALHLASVDALNKLHIERSSQLCTTDIRHTNMVRQYLEYQPEFSNSTHEIKKSWISSNIRHRKMFQEKPFFLLTFVPQSLQDLYNCLIITPTNSIDSLPLVVLLSHCLIFFKEIDTNNPNFDYASLILQPWFKKHMLENYTSIMFWENYSNYKSKIEDYDDFFKVMIDENIRDQSLIDQSKGLQILINVERQRICNALHGMQNQEKDLQLFAASISLAGLFQAEYGPYTYTHWKDISICSTKSQEVYSALTNIVNPILRMLALNVILDMKYPSIFNEKEKYKLIVEIIDLLQYLLPKLPLLTSTLLFVQYHTAHQFFPVPFQVMADLVGKKLNETSDNESTQNQEAAFIALQQIDDAVLSPYLAEFAKRINNLSTLLHFNSTVLFDYLTKRTIFESLNNTLISIMYLSELAFDSQILEIYTKCEKKREISHRKQLMQLWDDVMQPVKIMTFRTANWITSYLQKTNKDDIHQIIEDVSDCWLIAGDALPIIEKWFEYRMHPELRFFAQYAALQLVKEGLAIPNSIDIIKEIFDTDRHFHLTCIIRDLFESPHVNSSTFYQILFQLHKNVVYFAKILLQFYSQEILESVLQLELERISLSINQSEKTFSKSFLSIFIRYPENVRLYLLEYLQTFVNTENNLENVIKDEYLSAIVIFIVDNSCWYENDENFSMEIYNYIFTLLDDQRFPRAQETILSFINSEVGSIHNTNKHVFFQEGTITRLEKIILAHIDYSENVLNICLLAYGNCLLKLKEFEMNQNISTEMQNLLISLFDKSTSEFISVRAAFCLIIAHQSNITYRVILSWFDNQRSVTVKEKYNILLQQTLYKLNPYSYSIDDESEIVTHIQTYSVELIDTFVNEVYDYIHKKFINNYLSSVEPNYIHLALNFIGENFQAFLSAVQRTNFGIEKFKGELCRYFDYMNEPTDRVEIVELYAVFGVFTVELVGMLRWIPDYMWKQRTWMYLERVKQISRDAVEELFQLLDLVASDIDSSCFFYILKILIQLAQIHAVSLLEVYQRVPLLIENVSYKDDYAYWHGGTDVFDLLLNLSSIKKIHSSSSMTNLITEIDIDKEFDREIQELKKKSNLFLRRNLFFSGFQSILNNSN